MIAALRAGSRKNTKRIALGIGDDCALLRPKSGDEIAITTDFSLENVHFRRDWHPAESIGHRCLARGLSDLAAMGAKPMAAFLSIAAPRELTMRARSGKSWMERFFDGLLALADRMHVPLAGGDTAESPSLGGNSGLVSADIVLIGSVKRGRALLRSGAKPGDLLYVTGPGLGGAGAELLALERNPKRFARLTASEAGHPHLFPAPRIEVGRKLVAQGLATACIDLSDGLSTDLRHLCEESRLSAEIDAAALPIHPMARLAEAAAWTPSAMELALHGGEDYELLFTGPAGIEMPAAVGGVPVSAIGRMVGGDSPVIRLLRGDSAVVLPPLGWEHFRGT